MDARFLGPYIITKNLGRGLYSLELIEDPTVVVHRVNGAHLKPYQTPCQSPESSTHTGDSPQTSQNQSSHHSPDNSHAGDSPPTSHSKSSHQMSFEDSFPPLPPPVPPFHPFKRQLDPSPGSSSPPFKKSCASAAVGKQKDKKTSQQPQPKQPQSEHPDTLPPLPHDFFPPPPAASSPMKTKRSHINRNQAAYDLMLKWRQSHEKKEDAGRKTTITVDDSESGSISSSKPRPWINNGLVTLSMADKAILEGSNWLTDDIVNAAQTMLAEQFSIMTGFQNTNAGMTMTFAIEPDEFIQILHDGGGHWVMISTIGTKHPEVRMYDSLYCSLSSALKHQIAALLATKEKKISVHFMDVQMQAGGDDCGLFAIAFATALCCGHPPGRFQFHQRAMRHHLIHCFERGQFTMFPVHRSRRNENRVKSTKTIPVFCSCRMPELSGTEMIQCSCCKEWFHINFCVTVDKKVRASKVPWHCITCR